jgi:hypothetical protein
MRETSKHRKYQNKDYTKISLTNRIYKKKLIALSLFFFLNKKLSIHSLHSLNQPVLINKTMDTLKFHLQIRLSIVANGWYLKCSIIIIIICIIII